MSRPAAPVSLWFAILFALFPANPGSLTPLHAQISSRAVARLLPVTHADRLPAHPDFAGQQQLKGHLPAWVRSENLATRSVDLNASLHVSLVLSRDPALQAAFEQLLSAQQDSASPLYHRWLSPAQVGELFGVTDHDLQVVKDWAASQGLRVDSVAPSRTILELSGTAASVGNAFRVSFAYYTVGDGQHLAATVEPSVPAALAPLTATVQGLVEMPLSPEVHAVPLAMPARGPAGSGGLAGTESARPHLTLSNGAHFITPADFAAIYDLQTVYAGGNTGGTVGNSAQRIAVIGRSRVLSTDIAQFASTAGIGSYKFNTVLASSMDPGMTANGDQVEATLDSERTIGTAPGAQTDLVISASAGGYDGVYVAAAYNVGTLLDPIMTISYSACEAQGGAAAVNLWNSLFSAAAAEGISVFVSAGDSGAAGCQMGSTTVPATQIASINFICSSSYVTCVGGTELNDYGNPTAYWASANGTGYASALSYIPEGAWNDPLTTGSSGPVVYTSAAGGGGSSQYISKPVWQTGTGVPADGRRDIPDVAFASSAHDGYYGCLAFAGGDCSQGHFEYFFGTSASAPGMAGIAALLNTAAGSAQGNLNPLLYSVAANPAAGALHDVTVATSGVVNCTLAMPSTCNNSTPAASGLSGGLPGYMLTAGYDQVTGLGSVDAARLLGANPSFTLSASSSALTLPSTGAGSGSVGLTLSSLNGFAGAVSLSCSGSGALTAGQPACAVAPGSLTLLAGGTAMATLTVTSTGKQGGSGAMGRTERPFARFGGGALLALVLACPPLRRRRKLFSLAASLVFGCVLLGLGGCGSGTAPSTSQAASAASYAFTITASSAPGSSSAAKVVSTTLNVTVN